MAYRFAYIRLLVSDFKACFLFYRDVMGLKATYGSENDVYADFSTGDVTLALFDKQLMSNAIGTAHLPIKAEAQDRVSLIFEVADVDNTFQKLSSQGITSFGGPSDHPEWGLRSAYIRDPEGNLIEYFQPLKTS